MKQCFDYKGLIVDNSQKKSETHNINKINAVTFIDDDERKLQVTYQYKDRN